MSNLDRWVQRTKAGIKDQKETAEQNWDAANPPNDSIKDRCGIYNTKYGQQGVLIVDSDGRRWGIRYPAEGSVRWYEPCTLIWFFDDVYEGSDGKVTSGTMRVTIEGVEGSEAELEKMQMLLAQNKWERLHNVSGDVIKAIRIEEVKEPEG